EPERFAQGLVEHAGLLSPRVAESTSGAMWRQATTFRSADGCARPRGEVGMMAGEVDARTGALAIHESAAVTDLSERGWLALTGADRVRFLQAMFTNDVAALGPGQGTYGAFLN